MTPEVRVWRRLIGLTIFAVSMGFLETAVVVYLREILYPGGFRFPLVPISHKLATVELFREAATLFMLISVGWITGRTRFEKFILFLYAFAIWDIFYYIFLKLILNWPDSLVTWDILFLIPVTWTGPVLAPLISCLNMIILSFATVHLINIKAKVTLNKAEWSLLIAGACLQFLAFVWDYSRFILQSYSPGELWNLHGNKALYALSKQYIPLSFNWTVFLLGELFIMATIFLFYRRNLKKFDK